MTRGIPAILVVLAVVAAASFASTPAKAADLDGDCCADLEDRVAELEATTARKGNRKFRLTVAGWVNEQLFYWDDGIESNIYCCNNDSERSRFKFLGSATINADLSVGYIIEVGVRGNKSSSYSQVSTAPRRELDLRKSSWFIKSKHYGKFTMGLDETATYHLLDDADITNTRYYANSETLTGIGITNFFLASGDLYSSDGLRWSDILPQGPTFTTGNNARRESVRYDTPAYGGLHVATSWGQDDFWDIALIYKGKLGDFELAYRIGYGRYWDETIKTCASERGVAKANCDEMGMSGTIWHKPTGLFVYGAYGHRWDKQRKIILGAPVDDEDTTWYIQPGIEQTWHPLGSTTIFGFCRHDDVGANAVKGFFTDANFGIDSPSYIASSKIDTCGGGIIQHIEAAVSDIYLIYSDADAKFSTAGGTSTTINVNDFQILQFGLRILY